MADEINALDKANAIWGFMTGEPLPTPEDIAELDVKKTFDRRYSKLTHGNKVVTQFIKKVWGYDSFIFEVKDTLIPAVFNFIHFAIFDRVMNLWHDDALEGLTPEKVADAVLAYFEHISGGGLVQGMPTKDFLKAQGISLTLGELEKLAVKAYTEQKDNNYLKQSLAQFQWEDDSSVIDFVVEKNPSTRDFYYDKDGAPIKADTVDALFELFPESEDEDEENPPTDASNLTSTELEEAGWVAIQPSYHDLKAKCDKLERELNLTKVASDCYKLALEKEGYDTDALLQDYITGK